MPGWCIADRLTDRWTDRQTVLKRDKDDAVSVHWLMRESQSDLATMLTESSRLTGQAGLLQRVFPPL